MNRTTWRVSMALVMTGAATLGLSGQQAGAEGQQHAETHGCAPSITALPLPTGMITGDVLAARGHRAAGAVADSAQHQHVVVWTRRDGTWRVADLGDFGVTAPHEPLSATGVDSRGDVAVGVLSNDAVGGWLVTRSGPHQLQDFAGGTNAYVRAINGRGKMVGEALDAQGNDYAAVWRHWWSRPIRLDPAPGYDGSYAQGVNDRGWVAGASFSFGSLPTVATTWSRAGAAAPLPAPADAEAMTLNNGDTVVGRSLGGPSTALVWHHARAPRSLGLFADSVFSRALAVNGRGDVVGFEGDFSAPVPVRHILFWPGEGPTMSLLPLSLNWADGAFSHVITRAGTVFGASAVTHHDSAPVPTMWRCASAQAFVPTASGTPAGYHSPPVIGLRN
ncbi:MAG: hypothetical protein ACRDP1_01990 [Nocardioidaceae bacterium]